MAEEGEFHGADRCRWCRCCVALIVSWRVVGGGGRSPMHGHGCLRRESLYRLYDRRE